MGALTGFITGGAFARASTLCLLLAAGGTGCQTEGGNTAKTRGVYTTLIVENNGFDMPSAMYSQKSSFGPGEAPTAVMLGYGDYNRQQPVTLEISESASGRVLLSREYAVSYGKAALQGLNIRLGGDYKARLLVNGAEFDSCQFSVTRTNKSGGMLVANLNPGAPYAAEVIWLGSETGGPPGLFTAYDDKLHAAMLNSISTAARAADPALLAQRTPGKVDIKCRLAADGKISDAKIVTNTLDEECGEIFLKGLLKGTPYAAWPEDAHRKFASDYRDLLLTVHIQ